MRKSTKNDTNDKCVRNSDLNSSELMNFIDESGNNILLKCVSFHSQIKGQPDKINPSKDIKGQAKMLPYNSQREIPKTSFTVIEQIESGNFGIVSKGELTGLYGTDPKTTVAIKSVNGPAEGDDLVNFMHEIKIMSYVEPHLNLVSMIGSCKSELDKDRELWLLLEFCRHGDLKTFVIKNQNKILACSEHDAINNRCVIKWAYDISKGMEYLSHNKIMHGYLAARNVLIDDNPLQYGYPVAKVADFGISKKFYDNLKYEKESRMYVPWKWMAFEYLTREFFTLTSDVWSFAVVLWEILSFGRIPYAHQEYNDVVKQLEDGYRLPCPTDIENVLTWSPKQLYEDLSKVCFLADPNARATFSDVVGLIEKKLSHEEISHYHSIRASNYLRIGRR